MEEYEITSRSLRSVGCQEQRHPALPCSTDSLVWGPLSPAQPRPAQPSPAQPSPAQPSHAFMCVVFSISPPPHWTPDDFSPHEPVRCCTRLPGGHTHTLSLSLVVYNTGQYKHTHTHEHTSRRPRTCKVISKTDMVLNLRPTTACCNTCGPSVPEATKTGADQASVYILDPTHTTLEPPHHMRIDVPTPGANNPQRVYPFFTKRQYRLPIRIKHSAAPQRQWTADVSASPRLSAEEGVYVENGASHTIFRKQRSPEFDRSK